MTLPAGATLGPYLIQERIGAGGMGAVWKARDTRLDRTVAIKTIEGRFSERFEREAKAIASLNHPNICTLHDVGENYLVMEFIDGQPVKGPLPAAEVARLGAQIADALDAAHRRGLTHRDLKPGNVLVTKSGGAGVVKVIDFGLAKGSPPVRGAGEAEVTLTKPLTAEGSILGTVPYMSPEQLQGHEADARSDIFALGCVLYEMLTGKRAFEGKSQVSIMAAILEHEPAPLSDVQPATPAWLDRIIRRCLRKNPDERWQSARDIAIELREPPQPVAAPPVPGNRWLPWAIAGACALAAVATWALRPARAKARPPLATYSFEVFPPVGTTFQDLSPGRYAISPDGQSLAVIAQTGQGATRLYLWSLRDGRYRELPGTDGANFPFWSPDSQWIAYFADNSLLKLAATGGAPQSLSAAGVGSAGSWGAGGTIIFGNNGKLWRVSEAGGPASIAVPEGRPFSPWFFPDGQTFLFTLNQGPAEGYVTAMGSLGSRKTTPLPLPITDAIFAPDPDAGGGHVLYASGAQLLARPFDTAQGKFAGEGRPLLDGAPAGPALSASVNGVLAIRRSNGIKRQMKLVDRSGRTVSQLGEPAVMSSPALSPDAGRVAYTLYDAAGANADIWVMEIERGVASRLTAGRDRERSPVWSLDGREVYYGRNQATFRQSASSLEGMMVSPECSTPSGWLPDGKGFLCSTPRLNYIALDGGKARMLSSAGSPRESQGQVPRTGKWLSYTSVETGKEEIYIRSLPPDLGGPPGTFKYRVSGAGGFSARWRADGRELFYLGSDSQLMAVSTEPEREGLRVGAPKPLFRMRSPRTSPTLFSYDVAADGQRFVVLDPLGDPSAVPITVIVNWPGLLNTGKGE